MRTFLALAMVLSLGGCGANLVEAPRRPLTPIELAKFPKQDWRLANNKFFLWRDGLSPEKVSTAQRIAKRIDQLDTEALPLVRRMNELSRKIDPLKDTQKLLGTHARGAKAACDKAKKRVEATDKIRVQAEMDLAAELALPTPNAERVAALKAQIAQGKAEVSLGNEQLKEMGALRDKLDKDVKNLDSQLAPIVTEFNETEAQQQVIEQEGRERVAEITELVDWYKDQPTAVIFNFQPDGSIGAQISDWNLNDDAGLRQFSTAPGAGGKPTITNVIYEIVGGVFKFDAHVFEDEAQTKLRETYAFKISRIHYDARDGRNFFGGDIIRTKYLPEGNEVRRGIAKLVDRNN